MSLRRILNDHPAPAAVPPLPPPHNNLISPRRDRSPSPPFPLRSQTPISRQVQSSPTLERRAGDFASRSGANQDTSAWDTDAREWRQHSRARNGNTEFQREVSPSSVQEYQYGKNEEPNAMQKKRKRAADDDGDYRPPTTRRHASRRQPPRGRHVRAQSPPLDSSEPEATPAPLLREPTEGDSRLVSSDLSDCEDIWFTEIGYYTLETRRRRRMVEQFFESNLTESNVALISALSGRYAAVLERIPVFVPPPVREPQAQSVEDDLLSTLRQTSPGHDVRDGNNFPATQRFHAQENGAEDAARELEESVLGPSTPSKGKRKTVESKKQSFASDASSSELDVPVALHQGRANKRRKLGKDSDITADVERSIAEDQGSVASAQDAQKSVPSTKTKSKGKGKLGIREQSVDSVSATPKTSRKRPGTRRKLDAIAPQTLETLGLGSAPPSVAGDLTPGGSRPPSPTLTATSATVFEMDMVIPPLKKAKKVDDVTMLKRIKTLEESQRKVWKNIARREIPKVYKYCAMGYQQRQVQCKRVATLASLQARKPYNRTPKAIKDVQAKSKRLMREMLVFWKKNEKEERDVRKRENKEAADRAKIEEEKREAARQARKLEFLISQTELYSHFVGNKLKTAEIQGEAPHADVPMGANLEDADPATLVAIDYDDADHTNLHRHARHNAQEAMMLEKKRVQAFDAQVALERKTSQALKLAKSQTHVRDDEEEQKQSATTMPLVDLDSDELNFQNPTSLSGPLTIAQPRMLMAQLKEYQLKGLNWLATLYDQGINGILADEMGLGKTVQSISLLAYLAETHDIWGPFLVVAPASTLHNWQQELTRFVPKLKALPYWGNVKDRATLRKFWSRKEISYNQDTPFHVVITSYQLVTQDQQYFQRVKWQYMVLDEAQNIKNAASVRWKTLLGFHCRNRLLLTGTPIQNSMQELWALLHFIMPSLFDSHDEFNEWFSKDIENAAENKGSKLNEHQLRRLHMILRPFMLRRVKRNVQNELSDKIEKDIYVDLSARQRTMYKALQAHVSVADLLEKAANIGDADSARSLMNLVMQFRKVCNHPELFERADIVAPYSFSEYGRSGPLNRQGDFVMAPYSTRNPIEYSIPELFYLDGGLRDVPNDGASVALQPDRGVLHKLMNIWSTDWIQHSLMDDHSSFSFLPFLNMSPGETHALHCSPILRRCLVALEEERMQNMDSDFFIDDEDSSSPWLILPRHRRLPSPSVCCLPGPGDIASSSWLGSLLSRPGLRWFVPPVVAPPVTMYCPNRTFVEHQATLLEAPFESLALYGLTPALSERAEPSSLYTRLVPGLPSTGLIASSSRDQIPGPKMQVPEAKSLVYDSAKLARLDHLLQELKAGDHRVLIYFQMTRMMDLMEEYLIYRQYRYLRLDGSSKLEDRRDMVMDWQTRPDIFIFILSTRAGGLGINLTAADTVVFYDHDWNPSNDAQAMDRAHRLGQTRQVTVYRLITKGTIDERIVQLARVKKDVQDIVVGNKTFTDATKPSEIVQLLLNEDQLASLDASSGVPGPVPTDTSGGMSKTAAASTRDLWTEEGDEFFGHSGSVQPGLQESGKDMEDGTATPKPARSNKRSRAGASTGSRGGKATAKGGSRRKPALESGNISAR